MDLLKIKSMKYLNILIISKLMVMLANGFGQAVEYSRIQSMHMSQSHSWENRTKVVCRVDMCSCLLKRKLKL